MDTRHKTQDAGRRTHDARRTGGSAIILAVVLTSLLAIVGVIFLLSSRVDSVATSAIADNKDLNLAVDTVIAQISEVLAADVPGIDPNGEYYDYPDPCLNSWLACLEPYSDAGTPRWRQVSNIYGSAVQNMEAVIIPDYQPTVIAGNPADADGDGVGDSIWMEVPGKTSARGKPIYAAIRIVDNSAMLNVNTGYKFDPCDPDVTRINGSSQKQINYAALSQRGANGTLDTAAANLATWRCGTEPNYLYELNVIWQYGNPIGAFTPFDISDELKLRNRYILLNYNNPVKTRIENLWTNTYKIGPEVPRSSISDPNDWFWIVYNSYPSPCPDPCTYDYRHIATIQNLDRIIDPNGVKMLNINSASQIDPNNTRKIIADVLVTGGVLPADADILGAQITANLIDYVDADSNVTVVYDSGGFPRLGFEQPCVYISELAQNFFEPDANDPCIIERGYAIELYKPYPEDLPPGLNEWRLVISGIPPIDFGWTGSTRFHVFLNDAYDRINVDFNDFPFSIPSPFNGEIGVEPNVVLQWSAIPVATSYNVYLGTNQTAVFAATPNDIGVFQGNVLAPTTTFDPPGLLDINTIYYWRIEPIGPGIVTRGLVWRFTVSQIRPLYAPIAFDDTSIILLQRKVPGLGGDGYVTVDTVFVPLADPNTGWLKPSDPNDPNARLETHSYQRDIWPHKPIRHLFSLSNIPSIGNHIVTDFNAAALGPFYALQVQAHPANQAFTNIGQFGQLFYRNTYGYNYGGIDVCLPDIGITEPQMRIDLALPIYQQLFNYLTVFDPVNYGHDANETRIKGRININTAPWFVLAQLPWVSYHTPDYDLARAIAYYRDIRVGYKSIGELMTDANSSPGSIGYYEGKFIPDVLRTPEDCAGDIFEERDVIFDRISNLVTVRSDVFTAYILVRIGPDGPQKRVVAILDRSDVTSAGGKVKVIAMQSVPDPR